MANINKNIIMQAGAAVANATNKAAGLSAATPEPGSIISAIQLVNGGRTIGPAALAHFTESVRNKLLSLLVSMEPIQDFNGYGHPWPAGGGKNLIDPTGIQNSRYLNSSGAIGTSSGWSVSGLVSVTPGETYVLNIVNTGAAAYHALYNESQSLVSTVVSTTNPITIPSGIFYIRLSMRTLENDPATTAQFEKGTVSTEYTPYSNICPISGRTGLDVYVGPTSEIGDATASSMDWTTPAGTVYAGSADVVSGDIKAAPYYASYNGETLVGPWVSSMDVYDPEGTPSTGAQVVDLGGTMTEYHITGQEIITLVGDNYIWSDSGDVTITE